jgi:hypothetical protein
MLVCSLLTLRPLALFSFNRGLVVTIRGQGWSLLRGTMTGRCKYTLLTRTLRSGDRAGKTRLLLALRR